MKKKKMFSNLYFKNGAYSMGVILAVIAIVVVVNLLVNQIPSGTRQLDMSSSRIYTIGDVTAEFLKKLDTDVKLTVISEPTRLDPRIAKLVENYEALSGHIKSENVDPVLHPSVLTENETEGSSIIVSSEQTGKKTEIKFDSIIKFDEMSYYYYGQYKETEFDGEGQLTSAIDYVSKQNSKTIYSVEGHGEAALSQQISDLIDKANMKLSSVNLLKQGKVPEDCDLLIINAPENDLANDEKAMLENYLAQGGNAMLLLGTSDAELPNLESVLKDYGMTVAEGLIADMDNFYQNSYYNIFPVLSTSSDISKNVDAKDLALVINAKGLELVAPARDSIKIDSFMTTSDNSYAVTGEEQTKGTYTLGATAVETTADNKQSRLVVFSAGSMIDEYITSSFTNLSNLDLFMNAVTWNFDDVSNISIPARSLEEAVLTIPSAGTWGILFMIVIPAVIIAAGFTVWVRRRRA